MTVLTRDFTLEQLTVLCRDRLKKVFVPYLHESPSLELKSAMEYVLFNVGKQLRPALIYATGVIFNAPLENMDLPASAVEIIHTYSLIHDDLPCMDNADLRRGKPTCHKVVGEGMAVLTGDALHTLAMQILASHPAPLKTEKRLGMLAVLSKACGPFGMAAGQALDLSVMTDTEIPSDLLLDIYRLKTGMLFSACIELGWLSSTDDDESNLRALRMLGDCIGLAFQIQDDIIDVETDETISGKTSAIDIKNNKVTYPLLHGMTAAKQKVQSLYQEALEAINYLGERAHLLRELIGQMLARVH